MLVGWLHAIPDSRATTLRDRGNDLRIGVERICANESMIKLSLGWNVASMKIFTSAVGCGRA